MALIPNTLETVLAEAFDKGMLVFAETIKNSPPGTDVSDDARRLAAKTFAAIASTAIDAYIRSATIIVPPGQVVTAASPAGPVAGSTTSPSAPAIIS